MKISYSYLAGSSVARLAALSDGIFAVAMTLLVLELHAPVKDVIHTEGDLWNALLGLLPAITTCLMSVLWASIVVFIAVQLNFAIGPRSGWPSRA